MSKIKPPTPKKIDHKVKIHGHILNDEYAWMKDVKRSDPEVIKHLEAENDYCKAVMADTEELQERLFKEITDRVEKKTQSFPVKYGKNFYYTRREAEDDYWLECRKMGSRNGPEEILFDVNKRAEGKKYYSFFMGKPSPDEKYIPYFEDLTGSEIDDLTIWDVKNKKPVEKIQNALNLVWLNNGAGYYYGKKTLNTKRIYRIYLHIMGEDPDKDKLIFEEKDEAYSCYIESTLDKELKVITSYSNDSTECYFLKDHSEPTLIEKRKKKHEYYTEGHRNGKLFIRTNDNALNFKLVEVSLKNPSRDNWKVIIPAREDVKIKSCKVLSKWMAIKELANGVESLRLIDSAMKVEYKFKTPETFGYIESRYYNTEFETAEYFIGYLTYNHPHEVHRMDLSNGNTELVFQKKIPNFKPSNYRLERLEAKSHDGTMVPMYLIYNKSFDIKNRINPALLYGYGSYGYGVMPYYSARIFTLLDKGFIYIEAAIRGGDDLGEQWYKAGKLKNKKNTFYDFIACAEKLVGDGYTTPKKLAIEGASAGGLLVGAVVNMRPELFRSVVGQVPFVDVINTMLDPELPLTVKEYDEWGDPNNKDFFEYILSYSPYDNIEETDYPNILLMTYLNDSRVSYWEPAKFAARLRDRMTNDNIVLLNTKMTAGHSGMTARYEQYRDGAFIAAFLLKMIGN
ncbi:S9 family peptidase [bacterium]|nr:S9 family peptidase [bacterium]